MRGSKSARKCRSGLIPLRGPSAEKGVEPSACFVLHFTKTLSLLLPGSPAGLKRKLSGPTWNQSWLFLSNKARVCECP